MCKNKKQKSEEELKLKEGEVVTGKFFIERGNWLRSVETNISYNENYIVKIERL